MPASCLIELTEYTDPYCTWCWGSEPVLRKIEEVYGNQIKIAFRMGGLVEDMSTFHDSLNQIGGSLWYEQVAAHWLDASSRHGMPVDEQVFFDLKDSRFSTYQASIAYKSAQFQDEALANIFLRRMRESAAAERKDIQQLDVQSELATEVGLKVDRFVADIESGKAKEAFEEDLRDCRDRGIRGFPSFVISNTRNNEELLLKGFRKFSDFAEAIQKLAGNVISPTFPTADKDSIHAFIRKHKKVARREIKEVFDISEKDADEYLTLLAADGLLRKEKVGNGFFYAA